MNCRSRRAREAPSATRIAISRRWATALARSRLATFAQAMSWTKRAGGEEQLQAHHHAGWRQPVEERLDLGPAPPVRVRALALERPGDAAELAARLLDRDAVREARHDVEVARVAAGPRAREAQGSPHLGVLREGEARRHHADDRVHHAVELDRAKGPVVAPARAPLPQPVAQDRRRAAARLVLIAREAPPHDRRDPQGREERGRHARGLDALGLVRGREVRLGPLEGAEALEGAAALPPVHVVRRRGEAVALFRPALPQGRGLAQADEPLRGRVGERAEEPGIHRVEERRAHADADAHARDGHPGEAPMTTHGAQGVTKIAGQVHLSSPRHRSQQGLCRDARDPTTAAA